MSEPKCNNFASFLSERFLAHYPLLAPYPLPELWLETTASLNRIGLARG